MTSSKINKDKVLQLIKEEAYIITRKKQLYEEIQKIEDELKNINECMGLAGQGIVGTFGFDGASDSAKKSNPTGFVNPMSISHIEQLAKDMGMENPYDSIKLVKCVKFLLIQVSKENKQNQIFIIQQKILIR